MKRGTSPAAFKNSRSACRLQESGWLSTYQRCVVLSERIAAALSAYPSHTQNQETNGIAGLVQRARADARPEERPMDGPDFDAPATLAEPRSEGVIPDDGGGKPACTDPGLIAAIRVRPFTVAEGASVK